MDIASYVGGVVNRLTSIGAFDWHYGLDLSFSGILTSRMIQLGVPEKKDSYEYFVQGNMAERHRLQVPDHNNVDFLVASAMAVPFPNSSVDLVTCFNLLELVPRPRKLVLEISRILREGASTVLSSPYWWEDDECPQREWIGAQEQSTEVELRSALLDAQLSPVDGDSAVPWLLRYNARTYMMFLCDVIVAKKRAMQL